MAIWGRGQRWGAGAVLATGALLLGLIGFGAPAADPPSARHLGVASCAGTTCHGRREPSGAVVRQDELSLWQSATPAGAHSRAWTTLASARGRAIAARMGIGDPQAAPACLGCHSDPAPAKGERWRLADGIGCEACHGAADAPWLAGHRAPGSTHAANLADGLYPLERARARAARCLDCHYGSAREGQWADHRMMAAGHPRLSFELELFSALAQHWEEDADYTRRKGAPSAVKLWAVGQAMALERALSVYGGPRGGKGSFPEFAFFDCHACHRRIGDQPDYRPDASVNPGRPVAAGSPVFQDESMIMLAAAAKVAAPALAGRFDRDVRAFHLGIANGRAAGIAAAGVLRGDAAALADAFAARNFAAADIFAIVDAVGAQAARYTDYQASAQAVMALDSLLDALVRQGAVTRARAATVRAPIDAAYRAVRDPNAYAPGEFQRAVIAAIAAIRGLR